MVPKESLHWQQYLRAVVLILAQHPPVLQLQHWMSWSIKTFHITPDIPPEGGIVLAIPKFTTHSTYTKLVTWIKVSESNHLISLKIHLSDDVVRNKSNTQYMYLLFYSHFHILQGPFIECLSFVWSASSRCRSARITQMSHFRFSHNPGERSIAGGIWEVPTAYWWLLWWLYLLAEPSSYRFRLSTNILRDHSKIVPWGLLDPKYLFPVFIVFPYRTRYCKHISYKDTILSIEGPQLRAILGRLVQ